MHLYREKPPSSLLEKKVSFMEIYRATAREFYPSLYPAYFFLYFNGGTPYVFLKLLIK